MPKACPIKKLYHALIGFIGLSCCLGQSCGSRPLPIDEQVLAFQPDLPPLAFQPDLPPSENENMAPVSGQVTQSGVGLAGVKITVTDARSGGVESTSTVTDSLGYYTAEYPAAWTSIAINAQRFGFTFSPSSSGFSATAVTLPLSPCADFGTTVTTYTGAAIQTAINTVADGTTIFLPAGTYVIDNPIIMRRTSGTEMLNGVRLVGQGADTILQPSSSFPSDAPVIDGTRLVGFSISHLRIGGGVAGTGVQAGTPRVGLLVARAAPQWTSGGHHFENLQIEGAFSLSCVLGLGSEVNDWKNCVFSNTSGGLAFYTTGYDAYDDPGIDGTPPAVKTYFGIYTSEEWYSDLDIAGNGWNNMVHYYVDCYFGASNLDSNGCAVRMQGSNEVTFHSCAFSVKKKDTPLALSAIVVDRVEYDYNDPPFTELTIQGCHANAVDAKHFISLRTPPVVGRYTGVIGCVLLNNDAVSGESPIHGDDLSGGDDWHISGGRMKSVASGHAIMNLDQLSDSYFRDVDWTASSAINLRGVPYPNGNPYASVRNTFHVRRLEDVSQPLNSLHTKIITTPPDDGRVEFRGYVRDIDGAGVSGVTVIASGVGGPFITDWNGEFVARVPNAWAGAFTPMILRQGCSFSPTSIEARNVPVPDPCVFVVSFDRDNEFDTPARCVTAGSTSSLQDEIDAAVAGDSVYVPAGDYRLSNPLDFSGKTNVAIIGEGADTSFYASDYCTVNWDDDSLVNMSESVGCSIQRVSFASHGAVWCNGSVPFTGECNETNHNTFHYHASMPETALLLAGGGGHYFQAIGTGFWWRTAGVLSFKSEDNVFDGCTLQTLQPEAHSLIISSSKDFDVIGTEEITGDSRRHLLRSTNLSANGNAGLCAADAPGTNTEVNLLIQDAHDVSVYGGSWGNISRNGGLLSASNPGGLASIQLDGDEVSGITVAGTRFETIGVKNVLRVTADTASGVALHNNMMESGQSPILADAETVCDNWTFAGGTLETLMGESWGADRPMVSFDTLTNSTLRLTGGFQYLNLNPSDTTVAGYMLKIDTMSVDNIIHIHDLADMDHPGGSDSVIIADNLP